MKTFIVKTSIALLMLGCCTWAVAQKKSVPKANSEIKRSAAVLLEARPMTLMPKNVDNESLFGIYVGVSGIIQTPKKIECELGTGFQHTFGSPKRNGVETKYSMFSMPWNFNVGYLFELADGKIGIAPFGGINAELLFSATAKIGKSGSINLRDASDVGGSDNIWGASIGAEGGVRMYIGKNFIAKLKYSHTVGLHIRKEMPSQYFSIGVGYKF